MGDHARSSSEACQGKINVGLNVIAHRANSMLDVDRTWQEAASMVIGAA
jgi:hypothetical protein